MEHNHHITYDPEKIKRMDGSEHIRKHHEQARTYAKEAGFSIREAEIRLRLERLGSRPTIRRIYDF